MRYHTPPGVPLSKSDAVGKLALCCCCYAKGYGDDSYHPATVEYWPSRAGRPRLGRCRACDSECRGSRRGIVDGRKLARQTDPPVSFQRGEVAYYVVSGRAASVDFSAGETFA